MEKLYKETKASLIQLNGLFGKFEVTSDSVETESLERTVNDTFGEIIKACDQLDIFVTKEPAIRRYEAKMKVDQIKYDFHHLKAAFNTLKIKKEQRLQEARRREELLRSTNFDNPNGHVQLFMDHEQNELRHHNRLSRANDELDHMIRHGESVLDDVRLQNDTLKNVKRKILNVASSLGLSNTLLRMIERRSTSDKYVLYGGMLVTCLVMFLTLYYFVF